MPPFPVYLEGNKKAQGRRNYDRIVQNNQEGKNTPQEKWMGEKTSETWGLPPGKINKSDGIIVKGFERDARDERNRSGGRGRGVNDFYIRMLFKKTKGRAVGTSTKCRSYSAGRKDAAKLKLVRAGGKGEAVRLLIVAKKRTLKKEAPGAATAQNELRNWTKKENTRRGNGGVSEKERKCGGACFIKRPAQTTNRREYQERENPNSDG